MIKNADLFACTEYIMWRQMRRDYDDGWSVTWCSSILL